MINIFVMACVIQIVPGITDVTIKNNQVSLVSKYHHVMYGDVMLSRHSKLIKAEQSAINILLSSCDDSPGALLSWNAVTERVDESPLDLAGYQLKIDCDYGYSDVIMIDSGITEYHAPKAVGYCRYEMTVVDTDGTHSEPGTTSGITL